MEKRDRRCDHGRKSSPTQKPQRTRSRCRWGEGWRATHEQIGSTPGLPQFAAARMAALLFFLPRRGDKADATPDLEEAAGDDETTDDLLETWASMPADKLAIAINAACENEATCAKQISRAVPSHKPCPHSCTQHLGLLRMLAAQKN